MDRQHEADFVEEAGNDHGGSTDDLTKAKASARRAAHRGDAKDQAVGRIARQWPSLKSQAESIVAEAYQWHGRHAPGNETIIKGVHKTITDLSRLNKRFAQLQADGRGVCVIHIKDALPITLPDFRARVAGEVVLAGISDKGEPQFASACDFWLGNCRKKRFSEIVFTSKPCQPWQFNLFYGFGVKRNNRGQAGCGKIVQHIHEVICADDGAAYEGFLNLLAWQLQNIGRPSRIVVALYSERQQSGKGILMEHVILPIFGNAGYMTCDQEHGLGRFNDRLRGCAYLFLDEAAFARDKRLADKIKSLCQAQTLPIETKGLPVTTVPSGLNLYLATNHEAVAHVETADARYWILHVAEHRAGDHAYFAELGHEIDNGGREAFLGLLLDRDVSGFIPQRDVPRNNEALTLAKSHSRNVVDVTRWLEDCLTEGCFLGVSPEFPAEGDTAEPAWTSGGGTINGGSLHKGYQFWASKKVASYKQETARQDFWRVLTAVGFRDKRTAYLRQRIIPDPESARAILERIVSGKVKP